MDLNNIGKVESVEITTEMKRSYLNYAMSVIVSRALPDVRDGLKPVHRRILYAMHQMGLHFTSRYTKSAKIVGEVLGKYHPHGDMPVYDALVRLAQDFSMRYRLISGQGNFGSVDGDPPAAMRYTEVKLAKISEEMLTDIEKETVNFVSNFDSTLKEPVWLPAKLPNLLLMGSDGIAVGMATKIPPHNLGEVIDATLAMLDKTRLAMEIDEKTGVKKAVLTAGITIDELLGYINGPDFPTGAAIYDINEIKNAYLTGRGKIVMRAKAEIEDIGQGKSAIIVSELPYQVNKAMLIAHIAQLVKDKKIEGISDLRDESDRRGIRMVVELKRDSAPKKILNNLYKHTNLQTTFPVNMVALVDGTPQTMTLKLILEEFIKHRHMVIKKRSEFELREAKAREHILEGLKIAVDHIDEVINIIKKAKDVDDAREKLINRFKLSEIQAQAILDMQLKRLAALERQKIEDEILMIRETIAYLTELLEHQEKILTVIKDEITKLKEKYADNRKTKVFKSKVGEFSDEQLITNEETVIVLTKTGYVKRQSPMSFKVQARGGKGVIGMITKEEDTIEHLLSSYTHDNILFFSNKGKVYQLRVWDLPEGSRVSKGQAIVNLLNIDTDEVITSVLSYALKGEERKKYANIVMATKKGTVKKTRLSSYENIRRNGLVAIKLEKSDELRWAKLSTGNDEVLMVTHNGKSIKFSETEVRPTARDTMGVRGILSKPEDYVVGMEVINREIKNGDFLTISEKGIGKKTPFSNFPKQHRGGQGVKVSQVTQKTGKIASARKVPSDCQNLILTSIKGQIVKLPITSVPRLSRATQGVILMRFSDKNDAVAAATCL
ncbi:DNA gyrase subunit A [Candidatus Gottesmanbacteria bacterium RIFCSPHIGHO2_02_FULL_40_24]|uniref:DNA gyrase subunit A n=1 Tax=Candidatus Gottesmanbacteria bacterium RIFCSPHIGHO2_01_FULL_40_15 TaxID=1798376 RepID=A0A1F5Z0V7_9BACT|nr:MAG: DNA gyrase subunit A [Candidatus Gottesmanbacteria bacterium RIFCSPHIGHO2_01_FULL_40_15]OGG17520.1 MAG: DNA gyrase subunit A [Candidatus Gottesmanbacteria bacterium RIFCSPHIGHO2_02_FULL_40_24]OGG23291.1 MAG: DNA gyrase subunit A [Candidatus Gottesmanbacteria bacterium RIFCSPLOWO2_01_FULL_40_10]OGG25163.1 MAG: DNA gyrase subunit A [Candidatus Gottesmanbacteria bacterium RIFCSPHIGHO2_12_FULL_40_13]OGG32719.1 MAG: DNA gyrase subunit A [Candidatus Gottesmanbacteria bacterium RIFCSPLOWO2_02_